MGSTVIPSFRYVDAQSAMKWLCEVLGFERKAVYEKPDGTVEHAELTLGGGMIMLGSASNPSPYPETMARPEEIGRRVTSSMYVLVPSCDPVWERVQASGTEVIMPLRVMSYGGQAFTVRDAEGYQWAVGEYDPWKE